MTPLRQQMIDAMQLRGFSVRTHKSYLAAVYDLAWYYHRSPDQLGIDEIQAYFMYLVKERSLCGASCRLYLNAISLFVSPSVGLAAVRCDDTCPKTCATHPGTAHPARGCPHPGRLFESKTSDDADDVLRLRPSGQ